MTEEGLGGYGGRAKRTDLWREGKEDKIMDGGQEGQGSGEMARKAG